MADIPTLRSLYRIWDEDGYAEDAASLARSVPSLLDEIEQLQANSECERSAAQAEATRLREAIERHRRDITTHGEQVGEDETLWAVLDADEPSEVDDRFWMRVGEIARTSGAEAE